MALGGAHVGDEHGIQYVPGFNAKRYFFEELSSAQFGLHGANKEGRSTLSV